MSVFNNVSVEKVANVYFDGSVVSHSITLSDGSKKTLGVMMPGEYEFGTEAKEIMEILTGSMDILLPSNKEWTAIKGGEDFEVPASSSFKLKVHETASYCCSYID